MTATRTLFHWNTTPDLRAELGRWQREWQRLLAGPRLLERGDGAAPATYPAMNLWEDAETIYLEVELPGLGLDDLAIFVTGDSQLTIQGERKAPVVEQGSWHRQERGYGKFGRTIDLPTTVDAERVDAEFQHGVLVVRLPKREEVKARRIPVKFSEGV